MHYNMSKKEKFSSATKYSNSNILNFQMHTNR